MKKKKNAFTLIELLAIIVILAIIAVITVPIILNIIENSRKGAATDSAYGYKDAVNKYYVTELSDNNNLKLEGEYTVSDGSLTGKFEGSTSEQKTVPIPVSGDKPSSGKLRYANNVLNAGCLVIGDYKVTFGSDGKIDGTVKGDCTDYAFPTTNGSETSGSGDSALVNFTMDEMCPGCVFSSQTSGGDFINQTFQNSADISDYNQWGENFLGYILDDNVIQKAFACGRNSAGEYFCLEGALDGSKFNRNLLVLEHFFPSCSIDSSSPQVSCSDAGTTATINSNGYVETDGYYHCVVYDSSDGIICY